MSTLLEIRDLAIGHKDRTLYSGVSFDICEGDCIMLCGANGSGKTTFMRMLSKISTESGHQTADKVEAVMIPARIPKVKGFTLKEFVRLSCYRQSDMGGQLSQEQETALDDAIERLGLEHLADRDISTLSDGEFQKAGIAAALVRKASVIMLDEPTAFLDAENRLSVLRTLRSICGHDIERLDRSGNGPEYDSRNHSPAGHRPAVIFSTHDLHDGLAVADKVIALGADGIFRCTTENLAETVRTIFHSNSKTSKTYLPINDHSS